MCVGHAGFGQVVTQQPMAPVEVVVILLTGVQEDPAKLLEVVDAVAPVHDRVEAEPAIPDVLANLSARERHRQIDEERWVVDVGRVGRGIVVDDLRPEVARDRAVGCLRPDAVEVLVEHVLVRHVEPRVGGQDRHRAEDVRMA